MVYSRENEKKSGNETAMACLGEKDGHLDVFYYA
jgi:hypothetical protein